MGRGRGGRRKNSEERGLGVRVGSVRGLLLLKDISLGFTIDDSHSSHAFSGFLSFFNQLWGILFSITMEIYSITRMNENEFLDKNLGGNPS